MSTVEIITDEIIIVETSGEMPEVAYHGSIYYMTDDPEGPGLTLTASYLRQLKLAVLEGYRRIIIRDLTLDNRDKGLYRGLARCAVNWERLAKFCRAEGLEITGIAEEVRNALQTFLRGEIDDVRQGRQTSVNCPAACLYELAAKVGLAAGHLPVGLTILWDAGV
ncbi:MAG: hypothetical protein GXP59_01190 [Deltaproteobacteria bacterium]|nr:hypothetical protein [Deltaproteobacteria bacterium]